MVRRSDLRFLRSEPTPATAAPDLTEPIIAWRLWARLANGRRLGSTVAPATWEPHEPMTARAHSLYDAVDLMPVSPVLVATATPEQIECLRNECLGVHALKQRPQRVCYGGGVIGQVALWGKVIEHERGYRAEFAYPVMLEDKRLARIYGCRYQKPPVSRRRPIGPPVVFGAATILMTAGQLLATHWDLAIINAALVGFWVISFVTAWRGNRRA